MRRKTPFWDSRRPLIAYNCMMSFLNVISSGFYPDKLPGGRSLRPVKKGELC